jgi:hypothetical protein
MSRSVFARVFHAETRGQPREVEYYVGGLQAPRRPLRQDLPPWQPVLDPAQHVWTPEPEAGEPVDPPRPAG